MLIVVVIHRYGLNKGLNVECPQFSEDWTSTPHAICFKRGHRIRTTERYGDRYAAVRWGKYLLSPGMYKAHFFEKVDWFFWIIRGFFGI